MSVLEKRGRGWGGRGGEGGKEGRFGGDRGAERDGERNLLINIKADFEVLLYIYCRQTSVKYKQYR